MNACVPVSSGATHPSEAGGREGRPYGAGNVRRYACPDSIPARREEVLLRATRIGLFLLLVATAVGAVEGTAGGVKWTSAASWKLLAPRPMRVATYDVPAAPGSEPGECGVFYFGQGQGGGVEDNFDRWIKQFEGAAPAKKAEKTVHGLRVHTIDLSGTYLASGGPMMQSQGKKPGYRLLGAIVEAPQGLVFFKCIGPSATIGKAQADFDALLGSLAKAPAMKL